MMTNMSKHGTTITKGATLMGEGFVAGSKSIVEGLGMIALTGSVGIGTIAIELGSMIYDGLEQLPVVTVWH